MEKRSIEKGAFFNPQAARYGSEINSLRTDALDRSKVIADAKESTDAAVQEVLMEMQTVREDCAQIERRLTEVRKRHFFI